MKGKADVSLAKDKKYMCINIQNYNVSPLEHW